MSSHQLATQSAAGSRRVYRISLSGSRPCGGISFKAKLGPHKNTACGDDITCCSPVTAMITIDQWSHHPTRSLLCPKHPFGTDFTTRPTSWQRDMLHPVGARGWTGHSLMGAHWVILPLLQMRLFYCFFFVICYLSWAIKTFILLLLEAPLLPVFVLVLDYIGELCVDRGLVTAAVLHTPIWYTPGSNWLTWDLAIADKLTSIIIAGLTVCCCSLSSRHVLF